MLKKLFSRYKPQDYAFNGFMLIIMILLLVFAPGKVANWNVYIIKDLIFIIFVNFLIYFFSDDKSNKIGKFFRDFYPLLLFSTNYKDMGDFAFMIVPTLQDPIITNFELKIFGVHPTWWIEEHLFFKPLIEFLTLGYTAYYLILPLLAFLLYFKKKDIYGFNNLIFTVAISFYIHYLVFILLPIDGPWRYGPILDHFTKPVEGYLILEIQKKIMDFGVMKHSGCFPSSHVAIATIVLLNARRFYKGLFPIYFIIVVLLSFATFFLRYHYLTDTVVGLLVGILCFLLFSRIFKLWWTKKNLT